MPQTPLAPARSLAPPFPPHHSCAHCTTAAQVQRCCLPLCLHLSHNTRRVGSQQRAPRLVCYPGSAQRQRRDQIHSPVAVAPAAPAAAAVAVAAEFAWWSCAEVGWWRSAACCLGWWGQLLWLQVVLLVSLLLPLCLLLLLLWLLVQAVPSPRGPPLIPHSPGSRLGMLQRTQLRSQAAPLQAAPACKYVSGFMTSALRS